MVDALLTRSFCRTPGLRSSGLYKNRHRMHFLRSWPYALAYWELPLVTEDNSGAISIAKYGNFTKKSKYIEVHYHFVNQNYLKDFLDFVKVSSEKNLADILREVSGNFRAKIVQKINFWVLAHKYSLARHGKDSVSIRLKKNFKVFISVK